MTEDKAPGCRICAEKDEPHGWHEDEIFISHACQFPTDHQAQILPWNENVPHPRHPVDGSRPEWSGYCVVSRPRAGLDQLCECNCHQADDVTIYEFQP